MTHSSPHTCGGCCLISGTPVCMEKYTDIAAGLPLVPVLSKCQSTLLITKHSFKIQKSSLCQIFSEKNVL